MASLTFRKRLLLRIKPYILPLLLAEAVAAYFLARHVDFAGRVMDAYSGLERIHPSAPGASLAEARVQQLLDAALLSLAALLVAGGTWLAIAFLAGAAARIDRRSDRIRLGAQAKVLVESRSLTATVVDASNEGCRLQIQERLRSGARISIEREGTAIAHGRVVWSRRGSAGVEFLAS